MFVNDMEAVLRHHHAEHALDLAAARRHHPMHRYSHTHEGRLHHVARWWSVVSYHYATHMRRAMHHAGQAITHPAPIRAASR